VRGTRSLEIYATLELSHRWALLRKQEGIIARMKIVVNPKPLPAEEVPVVDATPIAALREEIARARVAPARATVSSGDAAAISFLCQFRVLVGAARLYHRIILV